MSADEDTAYVIAMAAGDREALGVLYGRHAGLLLGIGTRLLSNRSEAEELLHDVFLEAWERAGDFDPSRGSVRTWLVLRMRSRCLDRIKSAPRSRTRFAHDALERLSGSVPADAPDKLDAQRLHGALGVLPPEQRAVIELGYFGGLSCAETAKALSIPIGTVKSRLHAALTKLRDRLGSEDRP